MSAKDRSVVVMMATIIYSSRQSDYRRQLKSTVMKKSVEDAIRLYKTAEEIINQQESR
jgi:hypothetical protein